MVKRILYICLTVVLLVCLAPVLLAVAAGVTASIAGCALDEGSVHPCLIAGADWGDVLYTGMMMAWFGLITLPFAGVAVIGLVLLALYDLIRYLSRRS